jgi:hypothetical protein
MDETIRHCRRCGEERQVYADVIANQRALRCCRCHRRVEDGPLIERDVRCVLLSARELAVEEDWLWSCPFPLASELAVATLVKR